MLKSCLVIGMLGLKVQGPPRSATFVNDTVTLQASKFTTNRPLQRKQTVTGVLLPGRPQPLRQKCGETGQSGPNRTRCPVCVWVQNHSAVARELALARPRTLGSHGDAGPDGALCAMATQGAADLKDRGTGTQGQDEGRQGPCCRAEEEDCGDSVGVGAQCPFS